MLTWKRVYQEKGEGWMDDKYPILSKVWDREVPVEGDLVPNHVR